MWTVRDWRALVYEEKQPQRTWPMQYGRQFSGLELNATHYRIHPPERMAQWAAAMPDDFRFNAKFPQLITHFRRFKNCEGPTDDFIAGLLALGEKRGPAFIQLPPHFKPETGAAALLSYLEQWPRELRVAVEFRHPAWFEGGAEAERVWAAMESIGIGTVISDTGGRRDACHMRLTAPFVLVRFGGYEGHPSDAFRMREWAERVGIWAQAGLETFDFLIHQPDSLYTPQTAIDFAETLRNHTALTVRAPRLFR
jgi:uncharacterized protein YecE (DUF72 family)